jgi:hypothetical protein
LDFVAYTFTLRLLGRHTIWALLSRRLLPLLPLLLLLLLLQLSHLFSSHAVSASRLS